MTTSTGNGKFPIRPRARIIRTIGEELISKDNVAILELVKNSYDADAQKVKITFHDPLKEGLGSIVIEDDGKGMSLEVVKEGWLEPATIMKKNRKRSDSGRRVLGEKGIGRFASAKLSRNLELITKSQNDNEIIANINWEDFDNEKKYLDEFYCEWQVREPMVIKDHGTKITLKYLNSNWDDSKFADLYTLLSRLINPFNPLRDFEIELVLPLRFHRYSGVVKSPDILTKPDYCMKGDVDENGKASMKYFGRKSNESEIVEINVSNKLFKKPTCGPFTFEFRVWNREKENIENLSHETGTLIKNITQDLNEAAGISIYRDGFRVLPYGEKNNDWLRLDFRRVQNPSRNLSNNQIVGYIGINLDKNPALKDQSNREGIVETSEFNDLKDSIKIILLELEVRRYKDKRIKQPDNIQGLGLFSKISLNPIIDAINKKLPNDPEIKEIIEKTDTQIKDGIKKAQDVLHRYQRLATLGQLFDRILHDGNTALCQIDNEAVILQKYYNDGSIDKQTFNKKIDAIREDRQVIADLFKSVEPFSGRKREHPDVLILENAINQVFYLFENDIYKWKINVKLPEGNTKLLYYDSNFKIIITNLLQNSIYWLSTISDKERKIVVELTEENNEVYLIFSDNGPGVKEDDKAFIFDPYFSRKPDGIGLGLTIIGEIVVEYNGIFELLNNGPLEGATFRIIFRRKANED